MPHKRRNRNKKSNFYCIHCCQRLWRLGSQKHYLFYEGVSEIKKNLNISRKNASFLAANGISYIDKKSWIEEFFCKEHGKMWLRVSKKADGKFVTSSVKSDDWNRTTHTINPDTANPSVSEFTYRMSRRTFYR